ncbi:coiled-coil domain-containing protein [Acetobacterium bakii]|uniref:coiled-coil domain-containing protein n=1 Tax=Acetobacterium bakii TaxID=52689 RepID=UPI000683736E|nr:hypothetical protein [Acetobacterium bakii]
MKTSSPSDIHATILSEINNLIHSLKTETTDDEIRKSQEDAQKELADLHREVKRALESLQLNAEWDVFSIAFYGETNAGKSTLIETLRILLKEPTKEKEREEFKKIYDSTQEIQKQLKQGEKLLEQTSEDYQSKIIEYDDNLNSINLKKADIEAQIDQLKENIDAIKIQIKAKRQSSITNFVKGLLGILNEQQEFQMFVKKNSSYQSDIISLDEEKSEVEHLKKSIQEEWDTKLKSIKVSNERSEKEIKQISGKLSEHCDGKIIGDGHSDFTRKVTTYQFEYCGQNFALLDLPGIEGKEDLVLNVINDAVQKAHAVFYVSSKPTPPQTGNKYSEGTLEKIKKHLGQQTEVYSIFNKRIKNYQQLQPGLINDDEKESLKELDMIMCDRLGERYEKHIVLSAYPAFLSIANCSQNDFEKAQKKFVEKFSSQDNLLQASLVKNFCDWITIDLVKNCKAKIKKSNYRKISTALMLTSCKLHEIQMSLHDLQKKLIKTKKATDNQLDEAAEILKHQLDTDAYTAVNEFIEHLRRNIYNDIDKELNNDEFKSAFECRINEAITILSTALKEKFDVTMAEFTNDVADIIEKYHRYVSELLNAYKNSAQFDFDFIPNIDIKSGVNRNGTISSIILGIGGVIVCFLNPAGWVVLALSIIGLVISIGKGVLEFLDHNYRASQQKKAANDNIEKMGDKISESVIANLKDAHTPLQEGIAVIKDDLFKSVNHIRSINQVFRSAETKFELLTTTVEKEGAN